MKQIGRLVAIGLLAASLSVGAAAEEALSVGGGLALLNKAGGRTAVVLIPGGDGTMNIQSDETFSRLRGIQLVRSRGAVVRAVARLVGGLR